MQTGNITDTLPGSFGKSALSDARGKAAAAQNAEIDFQSFLQLLTAQLRNQDPLSPLDSTEFVAQLANFSTVEQLVNANQRLDSIASSLVNDAIDKYASFIGKTAELRAQMVSSTGEPVAFRISGSINAEDVEIVVTDEFGVEKDRFQGINSDVKQYWLGGDVSGGRYNIRAEYISGDSRIGVEEATTFGVISEVRLTDDGADLRLKDGSLVSAGDLIGLAEEPVQ